MAVTELLDRELEHLDIEQLRGWLPVDAVIRDGRPAILWMDMRGVVLTEPFLHQSLSRLRAANPSRAERITDLDALLRLEKIADSVQPSGFIFHSSRCGSTLIANGCRALEDTIVISEAYAIDKFIGRFFTDISGSPQKELLYLLFLRGAVNALGQRVSGSERHFVIKFSCASTMQLDRIRRIWPRVPWVFLYRDPVETLVSNLMSVPEWLRTELHPKVAAAIVSTSEDEVIGMSTEEYCARAIGSFFKAACQHADQNTLLVNYQELSLSLILRIIEFFGISPSSAEIQKISLVSGLYSKDSVLKRSFIADKEAKQLAASGLIREMAAKRAMEPYQLLEQKRLRQ